MHTYAIILDRRFCVVITWLPQTPMHPSMPLPLPVIPVIDLKAGLVVRAVGGRRAEYRPIQSRLARDAQPVTVARAFADRGFSLAYVADLDAIGGAEPAWPIYEELAATGLDLWVDAGLTDIRRARALAEFKAPRPLVGIIAGLESMRGWDLLRAMLDVCGPDRLIFSLDLQGGRPLAAQLGATLSPLDIAGQAIDCGVRQMIVLDLAVVGSSGGSSTIELCRKIHDRSPHVRLVSGGGVRNETDLAAMAEAGCHTALVATSLHDGRL